MNLKTTFAMTAIALAMTTAAQAEEVQVYGKVNVSYQNTDKGAGDYWEIKSNASRFGIKGDHEISDGFKAFYKLEWQVDVSDESKEKNISARNQIVGLKGDFGTVFMGRHDTPTKKAQNKIDLFNDLAGDIKNVVTGEVRASNIFQYSTPKFGGFQANIALLPGEEAGGDDGIADGTSISATYTKGDWYFAVAQDSDVESKFNDNKTKQVMDSTRAVAQYKMGDFQFGLLLQQSEYMYNDTTKVDEDGAIFSVAYKMGKNKLKAQYGASSMGIDDLSTFSLGWDRKLSKKMSMYAFYTTTEGTGTSYISTYDAGEDLEKDVFGFGLVYKF